MYRVICKLLTFLVLCLPAPAQVISHIDIDGNRHTHDEVILRELCFSIGDTVPPDNLDQYFSCSEDNLLNTSLFVRVNITEHIVSDSIQVRIELKERWYYWVYPILEHADRNLSAFLNNADWKKVNYGLSFEKHNLFGRNQFLKLKLRYGYREQLGLLYENPAVDKQGKHGVQLFADRFRQRQVAVGNQNDRQIYFYQPDEVAIHENRAGLVYTSRPELRKRVRMIGSFHHFSLSDTLFARQADYLTHAEQNASYLSIRMQFESDRRDKKYFPANGYYLFFQLRKDGIGLLENSPDFLRFDTELAFYHQFNEKWYYAAEYFLKYHIMNQENIPYYLSEMSGYEHYPRGYELFPVHAGSGSGLNQTIKYRLLAREMYKINNMPVYEFDEIYYELFLYSFVDMAGSRKFKSYGYDNELEGAFLMSSGLGLECQTFYDRSFGMHLAFTNLKAFGIFAWFHSPLYKIY